MQKYIHIARSGTVHANIQGTVYVPDKNGQIETTNAAHSEELKLHGHALDRTEGFNFGSFGAPKSAPVVTSEDASGLIDIDELSRAELAFALKQRGVEIPENELPTRSDLAAMAADWNEAHTPDPVPPMFTGAETLEEVKSLPYPMLKAWCKFKGLAFSGHPKQHELLAVAEKAFPVEAI